MSSIRQLARESQLAPSWCWWPPAQTSPGSGESFPLGRSWCWWWHQATTTNLIPKPTDSVLFPAAPCCAAGALRSAALCGVLCLPVFHLIIFVRVGEGWLPTGEKGGGAKSRVSPALIQCFHMVRQPINTTLGPAANPVVETRKKRFAVSTASAVALILRTHNFRLIDPLVMPQCSLETLLILKCEARWHGCNIFTSQRGLKN